MIRLGVVAEGDTEREFVRSVLADHLRSRNVEPTPIMMDGKVSVQRLARSMAKLYHNHNAVTSLVDFYGFRGKGNATIDAWKRVSDSKCGLAFTIGGTSGR